MSKSITDQLQAPFEAHDVEWRVQQAGISAQNKAWVMVIPYITNRAIQQRLDDVFGVFGWQNEQKEVLGGKGFICGISIAGPDGEWVTKWDGAELTNIEPLKGGLSNAMKRAGSLLGIGRYLYNLDVEFAKSFVVGSRRDCVDNCHIDKKGGAITYINWLAPELPAWALPSFDGQEHLDEISRAKTMAELKVVYTKAYLAAKSMSNANLQSKLETAKDKAKREIERTNDLNAQKNKAEITTWLISQLKAIELIPNESAIINFGKRAKEDLELKCQDQIFDTSELFSTLETKINNQIGEISHD